MYRKVDSDALVDEAFDKLGIKKADKDEPGLELYDNLGNKLDKPFNRAKKVINNARKLGVETVQEDISNGNETMNKLLLSDIYNTINNPNAEDADDDPELIKVYVNK